MLDLPVPLGPISTVSSFELMLTWRKHLKISSVMFVIMAAPSRSPLYQPDSRRWGEAIRVGEFTPNLTPCQPAIGRLGAVALRSHRGWQGLLQS